MPKPWFTLAAGKLPAACPVCGARLTGAVSSGLQPFTTSYMPCGCVQDSAGRSERGQRSV